MKHHWRSGVTLLALAFAAFVGVSFAAEHPNLSGSWKLNVTKSDFSHLSGLKHETLRIEHSDPKLKVMASFVDQLGEHTESYDFTTDGKTNSNDMNGMSAETSSLWEGDQLIFDVRRCTQRTKLGL